MEQGRKREIYTVEQNQFEEYTRLAKENPRLLGEAAGSAGVDRQVFLGLLDSGMSLDAVIESLIMHGEIEPVQERTLRFEEHQQEWRHAG